MVAFLINFFQNRINIDAEKIRKLLNVHGCLFVKDVNYNEPPDFDDNIDSSASTVQSACIVENIERREIPALFLHIMCTATRKDGFHYGKRLLQWIASAYNDNPVYVFTIIDPNDNNVIPITYTDEQKTLPHVQVVMERGKAIKFFEFMGFKHMTDMESFKVGYRSSQDKPQVSVPAGHVLLRASTTHLASHDVTPYTATFTQFTHIDPDVITKIALFR